jgi:hypothetical protein
MQLELRQAPLFTFAASLSRQQVDAILNDPKCKVTDIILGGDDGVCMAMSG